ncbi:TetR/AcrR family transcriptional regulator [Aquisalimonas lutea]|uniref:TetR/AcrR family transcriptional regulator n=1 Tax=Aquisalimonas lutea TaxID=1327750 RepID=UPI0025B3D467|nr:TetR/AcrR family transcriptional regulator [Aquisalimonas lutea]MDN3516526.1 TetR/AcrR family transcriptional regulator [Aquisalimonas lutea]
MAPRVADVDARREQIGRAAIEIFARDGFQGAAVGDIASLAGLSKGSIYRYFDDKEALFHAAFEAVRMRLLRDCRAAMAEQDRAWDQLAAAVTATVEAFRSYIAIVPLTLEFWAAASAGDTRQRFGTVMADMYREFRELVIALLRQGQAEGDVDADADVEAIAAWLVAGLDGLMLQHWFDPAVDPLAGASSMLSTLRKGATNASQI